MRVRDLGALTVAVGAGEQPVSGTRAAAMLALLCINVNQRVSVDALAEAAWGDQVTAGAASTLFSHVWRLRQLLEPGRDSRQSPSVLVSDSGGYRLVGGPSTVDSLLFAVAANEVRDLLAAGHADSAVRRAQSGLALWRGRPYAAFADAHWAQPAVARLEELRAQLQERRIEGLLAANDLDAVLSDLQPLVATMPFRESLRALQMQALFRSGRVEESLHAYQLARRSLLDEVGIEPGPELQQLHARILRGDPSLARRAESRAAAPPKVELHLPPALTPLVGRGDVVGRLTELVRKHRLVTVTGAAGCGKTRVAVEVARALARSFPDGVWFVDLAAVSDPALVVDVVISTVGFAPTVGATPLQDLRAYLQSRRMLLVLDNCEHVLSDVAEIVRMTFGDLGAAPECGLLTTSREPIGIAGEVVWTLPPLGLPSDGADPAQAPAVELFLQRVAAATPMLTVDEQVLARAVEICRAVDGLPLALELAAARTHSHSLADIAMQVTDDPGRLSRVGRGPRDHRATVRAAIEWSHRLLSAEEQRAHRRLSVLPGAFTAGPAAAVVVSPDDVDVDADDLLARLVHQSLVASEGVTEPSRPTTFRQLATVRSHARHALVDCGEMAACLDRRDAWTVSLIARRPPFGASAEADWYRAIDDDYATVRATLARLLLDEPRPVGGRVAYQLASYWYYRERMVEGTRWLQLGQDVLADDDPTEALAARLWLAATLALQRRLDLAVAHVEGLEHQLHDTQPERLPGVGEALVALAMAVYVCEDGALLADLNRQLRWLVSAAPDPNLTLLADAVDCCALLLDGQFEAAAREALSVQHRADACDHPMAGWMSTAPLIVGALVAGRPAEGIPWVERCVAMHLRLGSGAVGMFIETRADFAAQLGDYEQAARMYATSRAATRRAGMVWPNRPVRTAPLLAVTRDHLSRPDYERAWQEGERLTVGELFGQARPFHAPDSTDWPDSTDSTGPGRRPAGRARPTAWIGTGTGLDRTARP